VKEELRLEVKRVRLEKEELRLKLGKVKLVNDAEDNNDSRICNWLVTLGDSHKKENISVCKSIILLG
jgi:hypothetical protein